MQYIVAAWCVGKTEAPVFGGGRVGMRIYTRSGDAGETGLFGGRRVRKDDLRIEAGGAVDELNAHIGVCRARTTGEVDDGLLGGLQADLLLVGADLAAPEGAPRVGPAQLAALEAAIDACSARLPPLRNFILPGGSDLAAALHVARTVARRAERRCVALAAAASVPPHVLAYLNRLSDLLFVLARQANRAAGSAEEAWIP